MAETLTFANFNPGQTAVGRIYKIGMRPEQDETGVIPEMAAAFGHELASSPSVYNLGELIGKIGPAKELRENIAGVQEVLGTDKDAVDIARDWVERTGLLVPVEQQFMTAEKFEGNIDLAIITGGVRNWMARRADKLEEVNEDMYIGRALLVAGSRPMKTAEGSDVEEGMTEADYMEEVIAKRIASLGIVTRTVRAETQVGDEVMAEAAHVAGEEADLRRSTIANISNAGAWVLNGGQLLRALRSAVPSFNYKGNQFAVFSDTIELGTGVEPASTHQNPFSALGQITRNGQELARRH